MKTEIKKLPKAEIEIEFELSADEFQHHIEHALEHLKQHVKVDGFRPGQAPAKMVEDRINTETLLLEAGDMAVKASYYKFIEENKLEPIGEPEVSIIKIAKGNPFLFKAKIVVLPEISLPDYKEIAKTIKGKEISVSESDIEDALAYLQKSRAKFSQQDKPAGDNDFVEIEYQSKDVDGNKVVKDRFTLGQGGFLKDFENNVKGMKAGEEKEFNVKFPDSAPRKDLAGKEISFKVKMVSVQKMELPEVNDEFAKQLGGFDTLVTLKSNIKEGITVEKTEEEKQRKRGEILEKIAEKCDFEIPEKLVAYEQERLFEDLKNNITNRFKLTFENYLASIKQTEEEIKKTFAKEAQKKLKTFLVLREIGKKENIEVTKEETEEEMNKAIASYSKEQVDKIDIEQLKEYSKGVIFNEKIFQFLEKLSG